MPALWRSAPRPGSAILRNAAALDCSQPLTTTPEVQICSGKASQRLSRCRQERRRAIGSALRTIDPARRRRLARPSCPNQAQAPRRSPAEIVKRPHATIPTNFARAHAMEQTPSPGARASPVADPGPSPGPSSGPAVSAPVYEDYYEDEADQEQRHRDAKEKAHAIDAPRRLSIEPADADEPIDEDEFAISDGYDTRSVGSTSATSTIYAHTFEHGRRYQHFKHGRYPIPNDDDELSREDMKHAMLMELTDGRLFYAPIDDNPQSILDIGTGTGIWAIEVGDQYPSARVRGIDISPVQPLWVPPNVDFLVDDCEKDEWLARDVDLVHLRFMTVVLKDVPTVLRRAYEYVFPLSPPLRSASQRACRLHSPCFC